jgi:putative PIN family toxin of toxin-antitoxin system
MRIVIDTNVLIASLPPASPYHAIVQAFSEGRYTLLVSTEIYFEYTEILALRSKKENIALFEALIFESAFVEVIQPSFKWNLIATDADDNKFVDLAVSGSADFLVTNDRHFRILEGVEFPRVAVIDAASFLELLNGNSSS